MNSLERKLTDNEMAVLFNELFGMQYVNICDPEDTDKQCYVLYDESGNEYEGDFYFETLKDFFEFAKHEARQEGKAELQNNIKRLLGL